ncbi:hypothetical protein V8D89_006666 [Ganoderma adspersum]
MVPYTLTLDFSRAVDNLIRDVTVPDTTLHSRAQQCLEAFNESNHVQHCPSWAERIHKASSYPPPFTTPRFFNTMYQVADELGLVAGRRYVSAAICVCAEHATRADAATGPDERAALVRALHELSSTWAAFLLWPCESSTRLELYAHGRDEDRILERDDPPEASWREPSAVMARDNHRCFLSGGLDRSAYFDGMPLPAGVTGVVRCSTVSIIPAEVLQPDSNQVRRGTSTSSLLFSDVHVVPVQPSPPAQDIMRGILKRFCGVDAAMLAEHAHGPANTLLMHGWAADALTMFLWWLLPTETPNRYEVKISDPVYDISLCHPPPSHVAFVDHSGSGVDLPSRELLRAHTALALVLHRSGAKDAFGILQNVVPERCRGRGRGRAARSDRPSSSSSSSLYPGATGGAFWRSVVEYEGPEVCLEVGLWEAAHAEALDRGTRT